MASTAYISIYLQAVGGHFLGANAYDPANISINLNYSGKTIDVPYNITPHFTDDGNVSPHFTEGASTYMPIITVPQPAPATEVVAVNFISPGCTTIAGRATIELPAAIEFAVLSVSIPTTTGNPFLITQSLILNPAQPDYRVIVPVPGLYLLPAGITGSLAVYVRMMCGCPVTAGPPASLWPAIDFTVMANVVYHSGATASFPLWYVAGQTGNSLFSALLPEPADELSSVTFTAFQKSTGNYGTVVTNYR